MLPKIEQLALNLLRKDLSDVDVCANVAERGKGWRFCQSLTVLLKS
jgi:hypothetical protein